MCKARNQQSSNTANLARSHTHFQASEVFWYLEILHRHKADTSRDAILEKKEGVLPLYLRKSCGCNMTSLSPIAPNTYVRKY